MTAATPIAVATLAPRDYQHAIIESARAAIRNGQRRILLVLPTGAGKTVVAAQIILGAVERSRRVLFLAHRSELISQASSKLDTLAVPHGIVQADHWRRRPYSPVQVASVQTLVNRQLAAPPDIIFLDEAHRARAKSYVEIINRYPQATVIGLTATPIRSDGKGLGNLFSALIAGPTVAELTTQGYLVPTRVFAPNMPDLAGVRKTAGDYNQAGIQRAMDRPTITGDIVSHWQRLADNRLTVCFAAGVEHSQHLRDAFLGAGVAAAHLDGETDPTTRAGLLADLAAGRIRVLCSVGVLTEGWDCPAVACAILARPTASTGLYLQMAGRILRPSDGKADALILDHAGCTLQHGFVDEDRDWTLEHDRPLKPKPKIDLSIPKVCPTCYRVGSSATRKCPCGYVFSVTERGKPKEVSGDLQEITGSRAKWAKIPDIQRREMYLRWVEDGARQGKRAGFAGARFRAMFGTSPPLEWMLEASVAQPNYWRKQG